MNLDAARALLRPDYFRRLCRLYGPFIGDKDPALVRDESEYHRRAVLPSGRDFVADAIRGLFELYDLTPDGGGEYLTGNSPHRHPFADLPQLNPHREHRTFSPGCFGRLPLIRAATVLIHRGSFYETILADAGLLPATPADTPPAGPPPDATPAPFPHLRTERDCALHHVVKIETGQANPLPNHGGGGEYFRRHLAAYRPGTTDSTNFRRYVTATLERRSWDSNNALFVSRYKNPPAAVRAQLQHEGDRPGLDKLRELEAYHLEHAPDERE